MEDLAVCRAEWFASIGERSEGLGATDKFTVVLEICGLDGD